jgi:hypothetical protein
MASGSVLPNLPNNFFCSALRAFCTTITTDNDVNTSPRTVVLMSALLLFPHQRMHVNWYAMCICDLHIHNITCAPLTNRNQACIDPFRNTSSAHTPKLLAVQGTAVGRAF